MAFLGIYELGEVNADNREEEEEGGKGAKKVMSNFLNCEILEDFLTQVYMSKLSQTGCL